MRVACEFNSQLATRNSPLATRNSQLYNQLMAAKLIDGLALAEREKQDVGRCAAALAEAGRRPTLVAVLIGSTPAGELYASRQAQACDGVGIAYRLHKMDAGTSQGAAEAALKSLNADPAVTGIMLHLPVPGHLDATELQYKIDPVKDVEGVNPANIGYVVYGHTLIAPCTALAVIELIESTSVDLRGAEAVVVGASEIAGKPIALLLTQRLATVTLCHIATRDLKSHTRACGRAGGGGGQGGADRRRIMSRQGRS